MTSRENDLLTLDSVDFCCNENNPVIILFFFHKHILDLCYMIFKDSGLFHPPAVGATGATAS